MNVNFAITTPEKWASDALDSRSSSILSPVSNPWSSQRTPWARVLSSGKIGGDNSYRTKYALWSGNLDSHADSYDISNTFRPKFGLESIEVDFKGTMGSTRSCTVNFKCWTLEDLNIMEMLYMVPGLSVIVEWGWSLTSTGEIVSPLGGFLTAPTANKNFMPDVMEQIIKYRQQYKGSYDGLIGLITNFNYSVNEQLGFDCTFELTSPGEMWLEQNSTTTSRNCITYDNDKQKKQSNLEKQFHKIYKTIGKEDGTREAYNTEKGNGLPIITKQVWEMETREYDKQLRTTVEAAAAGLAESINPLASSDEIYISWPHFVQILNREINLYYFAETKTVAADPDSTFSNPKLGNSLIPVTILPKMMSLDPRICTFDPISIDPVAGKSRAEDVAFEANETPPEKLEQANVFFRLIAKGEELVKDATTLLNNLVVAAATRAELRPCNPVIPKLTDLDSAKKQIEQCGDSTDKKNLAANSSFALDPYVGLLNNIYLNAGYLRDCISAGEEVNMQDLLNKILSDLNLASGGLWDLQYHVDENDPDRLQIYDANYTSTASRQKQIQPYVFSLDKVLMRDAVIESKLVEGFKTMVLYGQAEDEGNGNNSFTGMQLYSDNVKDGFRPDFNAKQNNQCDDAKAPSAASGDQDLPAADVDAAYFILLDGVDDESVSNAKNAMKAYLGYLNKYRKDISNNLPRQQNILLPFNFSVTIDGFSGFIWGNVITLDYLPSRYTNKVYFQITKVKHSVSSTDWTTSIETVMRLINTNAGNNTYEAPAYSPAQIRADTLKEANEQFGASDATATNVQRTKDLYQKNPKLQIVTDEQLRNSKDYFHPAFWKGEPGATVFTKDAATANAEIIYDAKGTINDDEDAVYGVFRACRTGAMVSYLSMIFYDKYKHTLLGYLKSFLNEGELQQVYDIVNPLPPYRVGGATTRSGPPADGNKVLPGRYSTFTDNNPFNLRPNSGPQFNGYIGKKEGFRGNTSIGYFAVFDTKTNGIRAGLKNLEGYFTRRNLKTVTQIINTYAPGGGVGQPQSATDSYVSFVTNYLKSKWDPNVTATTMLSFAGALETNSKNIKMFKELNKAVLKQEGKLTADLIAAIDSFDIKNLA